LTYLKKLVNKKTAGILIELIQGEGGINEADKEFIKELYNFAKKMKAFLQWMKFKTFVFFLSQN